MKGEINLYDVLRVDKNASWQTIKNAYRKLVPIYHPDRGGDPELFELITNAFNILSNSSSRSEYDDLTKLAKQSTSDYSALKKAADDFFKAQELTEEEYNEQQTNAKKLFKMENSNLNRKHNFDPTDVGPIEENILNTRMRDLEVTREQDEIELSQDKLFDGADFNLAKFNAVFDAMHKRNDELIPHSGNPNAFNDANDISFGSYNNSYDTLYDESEYVGDNTNANINLNNKKSTKKISKNDIKNIEPVDYVKGHNKKDVNYNRSLEELMKEREIEDNKYNDRSFADFDTDPNMGGYGIFNEVGITGNELEWMGDLHDMQHKYDKLLELNKKNNKK
jgi:curved DNA-binding protein CbpA